MMARVMMLELVLLLTGCASAPPAPQVVDVPVAVGCLGGVPVRPVSRYGVGDWPGDKAAAQAALADANAWEEYATGLEGAMAGCSRRPDGKTIGRYFSGQNQISQEAK